MSEPLSPVGEAILRAERNDALAGYDRMKAEVERLRAENARVRNEWADQSAELAKLEAENETLREQADSLGVWPLLARMGKLEAENAELRAKVLIAEDGCAAAKEGEPQARGGNVNMDEAKARLEHIRTFALKNWVAIENVHALDIALWLMEREPYYQAAAAEEHPGRDAHALGKWLREHPRPGS